MDVFSQINSEINVQVLKLCKSICKRYKLPEKEIYKLWVDSLPKEITDDN